MRLIDGEALRKTMYHEAFETDTDMQRWESGCWVRYKMFENALDAAPTIDTVPSWIPVTERLPEEWKPVLGLIQYCDEEAPPAQLVLWYLGNGHWRETWRGDMIASAVTHWMPLPEPPKEGM